MRPFHFRVAFLWIHICSLRQQPYKEHLTFDGPVLEEHDPDRPLLGEVDLEPVLAAVGGVPLGPARLVGLTADRDGGRGGAGEEGVVGRVV